MAFLTTVISSVTQMMTDSLFHFGRSGSVLALVYQFRDQLDLLRSVYVTLFIMICMEIIYRHVKLNQRIHRFMIGWCHKLGVLLGSVGYHAW